MRTVRILICDQKLRKQFLISLIGKVFLSLNKRLGVKSKLYEKETHWYLGLIIKSNHRKKKHKDLIISRYTFRNTQTSNFVSQ